MTDDIVVTGGGAVRTVDLEALPKAIAARASRAEAVTQLLLSAAGGALVVAGLAVTEGDPRPRLGMVIGTTFGCFLTNAAYQHRLAELGPAGASPRLFAATVSNAAAGELAIAYRLGGPSITLTAGRVAGLVAIAHAVDLLHAGQADALVAGGVDAGGEELGRWIMQGGFGSTLPVWPGAAVLVLERAEHARARGARVLGVVCDSVVSFDALTFDCVGRRIPAPGLAAAGPLALWEALTSPGANGVTTIGGHCQTGHAASVSVRVA